ncbi:DUF4174 domain-containing protein [Mycolicibacterium rufum]|uniref:DUF4174 domain-containing protein n=1 Tax=Mycolicibacterium rufum TaxID=318424 RepID=A0A9X2YD79_9MYCO|nr:hypothetical protein EU78_27370 [Mycolicibacterium rufum]MCV7070536.1 DUF4174 domain-containing protein [Mycolicibacterium rufum]ULP36859.2 DUF4174 domain-containing protein [Mycolicibacterium rufum]
MAAHLGVRRCVLLLVLVVASAALGSGTAAAAGLDDYRWERRPLLVFAPTDADPRLTETLNRIEATRCAFEGRDMVLGRILTTGTSTLDGQAIDAGERQRLVARFGVGADDFAVLLIGKDGGEKLRFTDLPDLQAIYTVIDGMPMRQREMRTDTEGC